MAITPPLSTRWRSSVLSKRLFMGAITLYLLSFLFMVNLSTHDAPMSHHALSPGPNLSSKRRISHPKNLDRPMETAYDRLDEMREHPQTVGRNPIDKTLVRTEAGVDISDPRLYYQGEDLKGDSSTATVMGMATGYHLDVYERFVGSLRKTGFKGNIILGVSPDVSQEVLVYLKYRNVTAKIIRLEPCSFQQTKEEYCAYPYLDVKTRWSRFPLQRDWLEECPSCTGPILTTDVRDTFFQLDPFGPGSPVVKGLFVMEEHASQRTTHWLTDVPFKKCKGIHLDEVMLCSGTTVGTRVAMMKYFQVMYGEMKAWASDPHCHFAFHGDDQSIHNYLYYSGQLPFATAWPNRAGGIVNTVGVDGAKAQKQHVKNLQKQNKKLTKAEARSIPFEGSSDKFFLGLEYNLTNADGWFSEFDGSTSRVIHQYDRFANYLQFQKWLDARGLAKDPIPSLE